MGVQGLLPFLKETCPGVIHDLPNRLKSLAGRTVAIDATLITQRFHYTRIPHERRHILGWYRILTELRNNDVGVICVFDGKNRSEAKQAETARRQAVRATTAERGEMEAKRLERLRRLSELVQRFSLLPPEEQEQASLIIRRLGEGFDLGTSAPLDDNPIISPVVEDLIPTKAPKDPSPFPLVRPGPYSLPDIGVNNNAAAAAAPSESASSDPVDLPEQRHRSVNGWVSPIANAHEGPFPSFPLNDSPTPDEAMDDFSALISEDVRPSTSLYAPLVANPTLFEEIYAPSVSDVELDAALQNATENSEPLTTKDDVDAARLSEELSSLHLSSEQLVDSVPPKAGISSSQPAVPEPSLQDIGVTKSPDVGPSSTATNSAEPDSSSQREGAPPADEIGTPAVATDLSASPRSISAAELHVPGPTQFSDGASEGQILSHRYVKDISDDLSRLFDAYRQSKPLFTSPADTITSALPSNTKIVADIQTSINSGTADAEAIQSHQSMTKAQQQMTDEEDVVWSLLSDPGGYASVLDRVTALTQRSEALSRSYRRNAMPPTEQTYAECKTIIEAMGVPWVESEVPYEAEALASSLVINGIADYVVSEDTDVLVYQAPLLRGITSRADRMEVIHGVEVRENLNLTTSSFVDFAVLLGTDFSKRIKGVGPKTAMALIRSHGTVEQVLENAKKKFQPVPNLETYLAQVVVARHIFQTLPPVPPREALEPRREYDPSFVAEVLQQYDLTRVAAMEEGDVEWDEFMLQQDFFDSPSEGNGWGVQTSILSQDTLSDDPR